MKLTKVQKELLIFTAKTSMGLISTDSTHQVNNVAFQLSVKGLMEKRDIKLPFGGGQSYWQLTSKGWDVSYTLE